MQSLANVTQLKPARTGAIEVKNVGQVFHTSSQDVVALEDVSLEVKPGRFVVLVGPSGCGKSTLLMMMAGLRQQTSGTITISGAPIPEPDPNRVGVVFQEASLFPWLTAEENVEFPLALRRVSKNERRAKAEDALKLVGLGDRRAADGDGARGLLAQAGHHHQKRRLAATAWADQHDEAARLDVERNVLERDDVLRRGLEDLSDIADLDRAGRLQRGYVRQWLHRVSTHLTSSLKVIAMAAIISTPASNCFI